MTDEQSGDSTGEEDVTAQLLRLAGVSQGPPADRTTRVREAVHREWRIGRRRRMIRQGAAIALLGVAAFLVASVLMNRPRPAAPTGQVVATPQRIQGRPVIVRADSPGDSRQLLSVSTWIHTGDVIETDDQARAGLQAADGSSVRIDRQSRVRFIAPAAIEVMAGAAYIATADGSRGFEVRTAMGSLRDVGTQFEIRLSGSTLRLRVRSGTVEIRRGDRITTADGGMEAMVTTSDIGTRQVPAYGSDWAWTTDVAPSFAIEGRPLRAFLEHTAAEAGWTLRYANTDVADTAKRTIMHGSVDGLGAEDALRVGLTTSGLEFRLRDGELLVSRPADAR